ncbi:HAD-like protein [Fomitiporia mediterranea MF3/22]|uniref:HAD-like protein n=1 Tax=Fomitiporia mediterranea (strain MF3/22) TaxID=694068 RepID=UPI0004408749|nr:HAD-like protein [Fomitiporia mediterranea MF3/22]EJD06645.1 HAD-like protein [Fomitiporia mediterranea MF3/22]
MQPKTLNQFEALIFDVYGTLVDWETGIYVALQPVLRRANSPFSKKDALLAFAAVEKDLQVQHPDMLYNELLAAVHKAFATRLGTSSTSEEDTAFGRSIELWPIFPDTVAALALLKKYYKLVVLSNVDNHSFNTFTRPTLESGGGTFDIVLTAQDLGAYKPDPANFEAALKTIEEKLGVKKEKVLVTANSLFHDHEPANALGICSAWIERNDATIGTDSQATYDFRFKTLGEMAEARAKES